MNLERVSAIAAAALYEGYILYPYSPTAIKNRQRWTFGGVFPREYAEANGGDPCTIQAQCLLEGSTDTKIEVRLRFLHIVTREIGVLAELQAILPLDPAALTRVAVLELDGTRYLPWEEAMEQEVAEIWPLPQLLGRTAETAYSFPPRHDMEPIHGSDGRVAGAVIRSAASLAGALIVAAEPVANGVVRLSVRVENRTPLTPEMRTRRDLAQHRAFASAHLLLGAEGGAFVSLMDPPPALQGAAAACDNQGVWPVLAGQPGARDIMLASPIILYDYPEIAPESPGDLFDGTEIDEILSLRILTMTDAEKRDMAAVDARARALLERTERLGAPAFARMHGTMHRAATPLPLAGEVGSQHEPGEAEGLAVGDHVRLRPRRRADIMDVVLRDKIAVIEAIERDFEDNVHLAVTVLEDPGREFGMDRMPGHRFFFGLDEVQKLGPP